MYSFQADDNEIEAEIVGRINQLIRSGGDENQLYQLLSHPVLGMSDFILPFAAPLYLSELNYITQSLNAGLKKSTIAKTCKFLLQVAKINGAVRNNDVEQFWLCAADEDSKLVNPLSGGATDQPDIG
jgi:hypothetical protein